MSEAYKNLEGLREIVGKLRRECPWDKVQTHESLKAACIEEAAEVICGINLLREKNDADSLKEELGDLLLQVVFHAQLACEEGLFTLDDVIEGVIRKMIRRHPHVFHEPMLDENGNAVVEWKAIKELEKRGREWEAAYFPPALDEAKHYLEEARLRKLEEASKE